jgi:hypothetical protein
MKVSPGFISARNTAWFIWLPELGCTFANSQPNSFLARSNRDGLSHVYELTAAVIAPSRIALRVFVGQHRTLRLEHRPAHDVLRGDQLDLVALAAELLGDHVGDFGVGLRQRGGKERVFLRGNGLGSRTFSNSLKKCEYRPDSISPRKAPSIGLRVG